MVHRSHVLVEASVLRGAGGKLAQRENGVQGDQGEDSGGDGGNQQGIGLAEDMLALEHLRNPQHGVLAQ